MNNLWLIKRLADQFNTEVYLVGGTIRDYLMNKTSRDFDFAVKGKVGNLAREFSNSTGGSFIVLDKERQTYRVVVKEQIYDFSLCQGNNIIEDLLARDFTINALALPVKKITDRKFTEKMVKEELIDPVKGKKDIERGIIRAVNNQVFTDDPLRLLRAVRFKAQFDFSVHKTSEELMKKASKKIREAAEERIKEELIKILVYDNSAFNIAYLEEKFSLLSILIPDINKLKRSGQCKYHQEDIWTHSVYGVEKLEQLKEDNFWANRIVPKNWPLLKLGVLFHDIGKLLTEEVIDGEVHFYDHQREGPKYIDSILRRLAFSKQEISYIKTVIRYHMRPFSLYSADNLTFKGKYRFFRAAKEWTADVCLAAAADMLSTVELNRQKENITDSLEFLRELIKEKEAQTEKTKKKLISGDDIMELLSISEGPEVGEIKEKIEAAQAEGKISTREEALEYLKNQFTIDN